MPTEEEEGEQQPSSDVKGILQDSRVQRDILLYFVLPSIALATIYLVPSSEQLLEFKARDPTLVGIIGSNLAHRSVSHISGNIVGYWILGGVSYMLMKRSKSAQIYRYAFIAYLSILPFFASETVLIIFSDHPEIIAEYESVGFSQTVGAVTGFLPIAIASYYSNIVRKNVVWYSVGLFSLGFTVAFYNLGVMNKSILIVGGSAIMILLYMSSRLAQSVDSLFDQRVLYLGFSTLLFLVGIQSLFPPSAPAGIYAHMAGYVWGYLLPLSGIAGMEIFRTSRGAYLNR